VRREAPRDDARRLPPAVLPPDRPYTPASRLPLPRLIIYRLYRGARQLPSPHAFSPSFDAVIGAYYDVAVRAPLMRVRARCACRLRQDFSLKEAVKGVCFIFSAFIVDKIYDYAMPSRYAAFMLYARAAHARC